MQNYKVYMAKMINYYSDINFNDDYSIAVMNHFIYN